MKQFSLTMVCKISFLLILLHCFCPPVFTAPTVLQGVYQDDDVKHNSNENRHFWSDRKYQWPKGKIPYMISTEYTVAEVRIILSAMKEWEDKTCIRFVPRQATDTDYVEITQSDTTPWYCYSYVGRQGGKQLMKMFGECVRHNAMVHEIGHLIGFNHEHQRPDRDDHITVHFENIDPAFYYAFDRLTFDKADTMQAPYDYFSVMQYPYFAFSNSNTTYAPSMTLRGGSIEAIYREAQYLSELDIYKTQVYYDNCE